MDLQELRRSFDETAGLQRRTGEECGEKILVAADIIADAFARRSKLLLCGNGGSAADCQHMAAEFVGRLSREDSREGLPAIALTTDTSFLTAWSNDSGPEEVFERQVQALGRGGDVLIAISTSGKSANVLRAVEAARRAKMKTIGMLGADGPLAASVDVAISVPSRDTQRVQECLLPVEHAICLAVLRTLSARR